MLQVISLHKIVLGAAKPSILQEQEGAWLNQILIIHFYHMYASSPISYFTRTLKTNVMNDSNFISPAAVPIWVKLLRNKLGKILTSQEGMEIEV